MPKGFSPASTGGSLSNFAEVERDYIRSRILPGFDWVVYPCPSPINPLSKRPGQLRVTMVTTCGVHKASDPPFNLTSRTGDASYREIPRDVSWDQLRLSHVGYNTRKVSEDINCVFPLQRLCELEAEGILPYRWPSSRPPCRVCFLPSRGRAGGW